MIKTYQELLAEMFDSVSQEFSSNSEYLEIELTDVEKIEIYKIVHCAIKRQRDRDE